MNSFSRVDIISIIVSAVVILGIIYMTYSVIRLQWVSKVRSKLLDDWHNKCTEDLYSGRPYLSLEFFEEKCGTFNHMMHTFWIWDVKKLIDKDAYDYIYKPNRKNPNIRLVR